MKQHRLAACIRSAIAAAPLRARRTTPSAAASDAQPSRPAGLVSMMRRMADWAAGEHRRLQPLVSDRLNHANRDEIERGGMQNERTYKT